MQCLENKTAIVTGGGQGIGRGIALELAKAGANVVIADLNLSESEKVVSDIKALGKDAIALHVDITSTTSITECVQGAINHFSNIDILVNNAGVLAEKGDVSTTAEEFDLNYEVNLKGMWLVSKIVIPIFKDNNKGKIINIASGAARKGLAACPAYSAVKSGVISLTQSLASALGPYNINVNAICPGLVKTPLTDKGWDIANHPNSFNEYVTAHTALRRLTTPEDIAHAVVFFASSSSRNITGQTLNVNGGDVMN